MDIDGDKGDKGRKDDPDQDLRSFRKGRISPEAQQEGGYCPHCGRGDRRQSNRPAP